MKKSNNKIALTEKDFEFICPVQTKEMELIDIGYFCGQCEQNVYDVTEYTQDEFDSLKTKQSNLCINFKKIVTTSLILNSALCVASGENYAISEQYNKLTPFSQVNLNQPIFLEHREEVEMGGGAILPVFSWKEEIVVPIEPFVVLPHEQDENRTKDENQTKDEGSKIQ